jgi:hypothetical protein
MWLFGIAICLEFANISFYSKPGVIKTKLKNIVVIYKGKISYEQNLLFCPENLKK